MVGGGVDGDDEVGGGVGDDEVGGGLDDEVGGVELGLDDPELGWEAAVGDVLDVAHDHEIPDDCCGPSGSVPMTPREVCAGGTAWLIPGAGTTGGSPASEPWSVPFPAVPPGAAHRVAPLLDGLADVGFPAFVVFNPLAPAEYALPAVPPGPLPPV